MKKKRIFTCAGIGFVIVLLCMWNSSIDYKVMHYTERLKGHIQHEHQVYSDTLFDKVEVERPWYSGDPTDWTYTVILAGSSEKQIYQYSDDPLSGFMLVADE